MTDDELKALVASLEKSQKTTAEQLQHTAEKLEIINIALENIGKNQGTITDSLFCTTSETTEMIAVEFFYNALKDNQSLAGIFYNFIDKSFSRTYNGITDKFDMILINGQDVAIIEVKYKAHEADLTKLITKKYSNFKNLFPAYKDYHHHLVLATFHLYDDLKEQALQNNVIVLQRKGDMVQSYLPR